MIVSDYKFAIDNGLTTTAIEACIKAFKERFEGHVETKGKSYLLDDEACEIILEIIKEKELRFISYDLRAEEEKLWDEYNEAHKSLNKLYIEKMNIQQEIIELERRFRELALAEKEIDVKLKENETQRKNVLPQKIKEFQEEAYNKWVYQKN